MANTFYIEPLNFGDNNAWGIKELRQNRIALGVQTAKVYNDSGTLKLSKGSIGLIDGSAYGYCDIDTITSLSLASISDSSWFKVEVSRSGTSVVIEVSSLASVSTFTTAYDYNKGGYYLSASKRCIAIGYKNEASDPTALVNGKSSQEGFIGENLDNIIMLTLGDEDFTIPDGFKNLKIYMPDSTPSTARTMTMPTLADNQKVKIKIDNQDTTYPLYVDGEGAETIEGFATINLSTERITLQGESSEWKVIAQKEERPFLHMEVQETSGTSGGAATTGSRQNRVLNTEVDNNMLGASLNTGTGVFSLLPGKYRIKAKATLNRIAYGRIWVYDIGNTSDVAESFSRNADEGNAANIELSTPRQVFSISASSTFRLEYRVSVNHDTNDLGFPVSFGIEKYASVFVEKLL